MSAMRKSLLFLLLLCAHFGCRRLELAELDFFSVSTKKVERLDAADVGGVVLEGELGAPVSGVLTRCGFLWSADLAAISQPRPVGLGEIVAPLPAAGARDFKATYAGALPGLTLYFRAFAEGENEGEMRRVFAPEVKAFALGEMVAMTEQAPQVRNDRVSVQARLVGWNVLIASAQRHGFVYSAQHADPRLGQSGSTDVAVSTQPALDYAFSAVIADLDFNTDYHIRAYALTDSDTFYSAAVKKASVTDGWKRLADMPSLHADGVAAVCQGKAYLGLGCRESGLCLPNVMSKVYQRFDPTAAAQAAWAEMAPLTTSTAPANSASVALHDSVFVLCGGHQLVFGGTLYQVAFNDFWKYTPGADQWEKMPAPPPDFAARTSPVAFVVNEKIYVGTGYWEDPADFQDHYLNDFWEYNPHNSQWRKVASLPARYGGMPYPDQGRYEAASFVLNGTAYVGGGHGDSRNLRDFWRFVPPTSSMESGAWEYVGEFKGKSRIEAVAFSIGGKGYYGMGYHFAEGAEPFAYYLDDWWEFDPSAAQPWRQRTPFQGGYRSRSLGFGIAASGYVGGGLATRLDSTQTIVTEGLLPDFWRYTPAKQ